MLGEINPPVTSYTLSHQTFTFSSIPDHISPNMTERNKEKKS